MSNVLKVEISREFSDEFMQSLFNLCDTGIEYWATLDEDAGGTEYYNDDPNGSIIAINVFETEPRGLGMTGEKWAVNGLTFMTGIERIMSGEVECRNDILTNIVLAVLQSDDSHLDTEAVDTIVQAGLYNELVWG
jgi:hypothetical protein